MRSSHWVTVSPRQIPAHLLYLAIKAFLIHRLCLISLLTDGKTPHLQKSACSGEESVYSLSDAHLFLKWCNGSFDRFPGDEKPSQHIINCGKFWLSSGRKRKILKFCFLFPDWRTGLSYRWEKWCRVRMMLHCGRCYMVPKVQQQSTVL